MCRFNIGNLCWDIHRRQIYCTVIASLGFFALGNVFGWSSTGLPSLVASEEFNFISTTQESWIASSVNIGAFMATLIAGFSVDKMGRKSTIMMAAALQVVGWFIIILAEYVFFLYLGRFVTGLSIGAFSMAVPVYIGEISSSEVRGILNAISGIFMAGGILFSYILGAFLSWQYLALASMVPPLFLALSCMFLPESQRYYLCVGNTEMAWRVTRWLREGKTDAEVKEEIDTILESLGEIQNLQGDSGSSLTARHILLPLLSTCTLVIIAQLSGSTALIFYTVHIFEVAGITVDTHLATILVGILMFLFVIVELILVDVAGRRALLLISCAGLAITQCILAIFFALKADDFDTQRWGWIPILMMLLYFAAYSVGLGPLPSLVMSELLPNHVIGIASAITIFCNYFTAFWVVFAFDGFSQAFGLPAVFSFFSITSLIGLIFIYLVIPETKLKTLEEIHRFYGYKNSILKEITTPIMYKTFESERKPSV